jgi:HCOMODA/2-hydroxy-3-carboxy-muconic semialdehyde decarboxylase
MDSSEKLYRDVISDLVAANRILAGEGVLDAFGHVSVRHPGSSERFLMSRSMAPALVTEDDIMEFDMDGNPVDTSGRGVFLERFIHNQIYRARPDVHAVVHSHSPAVIPFGASKTPLRPLYHNAAFLARGVPVFEIREVAGPSDMLVRSNTLGKALADSLGNKNVALMRGHGNVVVGGSLPIAVFRAVYTEVNAKLQTSTALLEGPITFLDVDEGDLADEVNVRVVDRPWQLWKRKAMERDI